MDVDIQVDVSRAMADAVTEEHGITPEELDRLASEKLVQAHRALREERKGGKYGFYELYRNKPAFSAVKKGAARFAAMGYDNLVVLGIGGSALGTTALVTALKPPYYNLLSRRERGRKPRIFVMDNVDPVTFRQMLRLCPPEDTLYNVVSKSGRTPETLTQLLVVVDWIQEELSGGLKDHVVVTTDVCEEPNHLLEVARNHGLTTFVLPHNVGGRFSVFSPVGMFPAAMLGMDLDAMVEGCRAMDRRCSKPDLDKNPAYRHAAIQYLADTKKGKTMSVMMAYADALRDVADWYRQLWAESLGKCRDLDGKPLAEPVGPTPIKALGVTDQHSQIQLYREGPNNKIINVLEVDAFDETVEIPSGVTHAGLEKVLNGVAGLGYLRGKTMNRLMDAELVGTLDALRKSRRPVVRIRLPRLDTYTVAQLLYMLEVETAMAGRLYGVNVFDQPGVEEGKKIAKRLVSKRGWKKGA